MHRGNGKLDAQEEAIQSPAASIKGIGRSPRPVLSKGHSWKFGGQEDNSPASLSSTQRPHLALSAQPLTLQAQRAASSAPGDGETEAAVGGAAKAGRRGARGQQSVLVDEDTLRSLLGEVEPEMLRVVRKVAELLKHLFKEADTQRTGKLRHADAKGIFMRLGAEVAEEADRFLEEEDREVGIGFQHFVDVSIHIAMKFNTQDGPLLARLNSSRAPSPSPMGSSARKTAGPAGGEQRGQPQAEEMAEQRQHQLLQPQLVEQRLLVRPVPLQRRRPSTVASMIQADQNQSRAQLSKRSLITDGRLQETEAEQLEHDLFSGMRRGATANTGRRALPQLGEAPEEPARAPKAELLRRPRSDASTRSNL